MENLETQLGLSLPSQFNYKVIRVDNGDNKKGLNATGEFVCKTKDEGGNFVREQFGKKLEAVILLSRAKLQSRFDPNNPKPWWTHEFNPLNPIDKVKIFVGSEQKAELFYKEIKQSSQFTSQKQDGSKQNNFTFTTVLYILTDRKTLKLELKGKSQGNWFDYSSKIMKAGKSLLKNTVKLSIVPSKDKDGNPDGNFECKFTTGKEVKDEGDIRNKAITLLESMGGSKALPESGQQTTQTLPVKEEIPLPEEPGEEVIHIEEEDAKKPETNEDTDEIKIEDIPF